MIERCKLWLNFIFIFIFCLDFCQKHFLGGLFHEIKSGEWLNKEDQDDRKELEYASQVSKEI